MHRRERIRGANLSTAVSRGPHDFTADRRGAGRHPREPPARLGRWSWSPLRGRARRPASRRRSCSSGLLAGRQPGRRSCSSRAGSPRGRRPRRIADGEGLDARRGGRLPGPVRAADRPADRASGSMTEGILNRQLLADPFLEGIGAVVLDEFHERSLHTDLALAPAPRGPREVRPDLILVVMSATLDAEPVARFLGDCPVLEVAGRASRSTSSTAPAARPAGPEAIAAAVETSSRERRDPGRPPRLPARDGGDPPRASGSSSRWPGARMRRAPAPRVAAGRGPGPGPAARDRGARSSWPRTSPRPR